jgi:hypothetical protein
MASEGEEESKGDLLKTFFRNCIHTAKLKPLIYSEEIMYCFCIGTNPVSLNTQHNILL